MYGKSRRIHWIMIGFDWIRWWFSNFRGFRFSSRRAEITRTRWRVSRRFGASEGSRIQEHPVHCCWKARDGPVTVAFRCLVSTCFNMFQLVCPSRMASRTSNLAHWDFWLLLSCRKSILQGPYPFCCTVFHPAAHGIGDDEGLPLTTSTTSHLSLVSSGLWTKLFNGCSDEYQMQPIYIVCRYTCWGETWWNMVKQGPRAIRFASSKSFLDAASMSWEDLGDMSLGCRSCRSCRSLWQQKGPDP
jgi:hypothetical protein